MATLNRKTFDLDTKRKVVNDLLSKRITIDKACQEYDLQPYQLMAWVGQVQLSDPITEKGTDGSNIIEAARLMQRPAQPAAAIGANDELAAVVGRWYLSKVITKPDTGR